MFSKFFLTCMMALLLVIPTVNAQTNYKFNGKEFQVKADKTITELRGGKWVNVGIKCDLLYEKAGKVYCFSTDGTAWEYSNSPNKWTKKDHTFYPSTLYAPSILKAGESLTNTVNGFKMTMQTDGNLATYSKDGKLVWATNTGNAGNGCELRMQIDNHLVIYDKNGKPIWGSQTVGNSGVMVQVENDGRLVMYKNGGIVVWTAK